MGVGVPQSLACRVAVQVRAIGRLLGVPDTFIKRHPFPGPGMGVRILGDVTEGDRLEVRGRGDEVLLRRGVCVCVCVQRQAVELTKACVECSDLLLQQQQQVYVCVLRVCWSAGCKH